MSKLRERIEAECLKCIPEDLRDNPYGKEMARICADRILQEVEKSLPSEEEIKLEILKVIVTNHPKDLLKELPELMSKILPKEISQVLFKDIKARLKED